MAMSPFRRIVSKLCLKLRQQGYTFEDVLTMYDNGAFEDAYAALCNVMDNEPQLSKDGTVYILWAELELFANDNASRALELLDRACKVGCSEMMGYYYKVRGDALLRKGNYEEAIQDFERSVAVEPSVASLTMLAQTLSEVDDSRAMNVWQQVLEKDPQNCLAHAYSGLEAAKSGDRGKAMLMAKRAEKLNPSAEDVFEIGILYHEIEEFQSAISSYLEADRLGYKHKALLYACITACYLSLGQANPARKYIQWALRFNPENDYVKDVWREYEERFGG